MSDIKQKCSSKEHENNDAVFFCQECKIYICNKCEKYHSILFQNHHLLNLNKEINNIFTGFCKEQNHFNKLDYYCKTHNILCCAACISKIKSKGNGEHTNCEVCNIEDIKEKKKKF